MLNVYISLDKYFVWSLLLQLYFHFFLSKCINKEPLDFMQTISNNNVILLCRSANKTKTIKRWNKALYLLRKLLSCPNSIITNSWTSISLPISQLIQLAPYGKNYIKFQCQYLNPSITNLCMVHILLNNSSTRLCLPYSPCGIFSHHDFSTVWKTRQCMKRWNEWHSIKDYFLVKDMIY